VRSVSLVLIGAIALTTTNVARGDDRPPTADAPPVVPADGVAWDTLRLDALRGPPDIDLGRHVIRQAAQDPADLRDRDARPSAFGSAAPSRQARIDRAFKDAEKPSCIGPGALKFDPPTLGPFTLGGILAVPFLLHAVITGRCRR
jgi:hypothetical protein